MKQGAMEYDGYCDLPGKHMGVQEHSVGERQLALVREDFLRKVALTGRQVF